MYFNLLRRFWGRNDYTHLADEKSEAEDAEPLPMITGRGRTQSKLSLVPSTINTLPIPEIGGCLRGGYTVISEGLPLRSVMPAKSQSEWKILYICSVGLSRQKTETTSLPKRRTKCLVTQMKRILISLVRGQCTLQPQYDTTPWPPAWLEWKRQASQARETHHWWEHTLVQPLWTACGFY